MDDPNLVLDFVSGERLIVLEELEENELNLPKTIINLPRDEGFRNLLAVLINAIFPLKKMQPKCLPT